MSLLPYAYAAWPADAFCGGGGAALVVPELRKDGMKLFGPYICFSRRCTGMVPSGVPGIVFSSFCNVGQHTIPI